MKIQDIPSSDEGLDLEIGKYRALMKKCRTGSKKWHGYCAIKVHLCSIRFINENNLLASNICKKYNIGTPGQDVIQAICEHIEKMHAFNYEISLN